MLSDVGSLAVGSELPTLVGHPLRVVDFVRYQGVSGDMNPLHHDRAFAQESGCRDVLAMGMLQAGVLGSHLAGIVGPHNMRRFKVQWRAVACAGDVLSYTGLAVSRRRAVGEDVIDMEWTATRQTGEIHFYAWATAAVDGGVTLVPQRST